MLLLMTDNLRQNFEIAVNLGNISFLTKIKYTEKNSIYDFFLVNKKKVVSKNSGRKNSYTQKNIFVILLNKT